MAVSTIPSGKQYIIHLQAVVHSGSSAGAQDIVAPDSISGYKAVGIIGYGENTSTSVKFYNIRINHEGKIDVGWNTTNGNAISNHSVSLYVLYERI